MATRRIVGGEKTVLEKDDSDQRSPAASEKSIIAPAVPTHVIIKLLSFTFAMIVGPIGTYFTLHNMTGSATVSGALAAIVANVVLIGYVVVAMKEDQSEALEAAEKEKKSL